MARLKTLQNDHVALAVDSRGRLVSLRIIAAGGKATGVELISDPEQAEAWRMVVPSGRHTVDFVYGSRQRPPRITLARDGGTQTLVMEYTGLVAGRDQLDVTARFMLALADGSGQIAASVEVDNRSARTIDEVEFPVIGGIGGLPLEGRRRGLELVWAEDGGRFYGDVLAEGLPEIGRESDQFVRRLETTMFEAGPRGLWLDLHGRDAGLYLGYHNAGGDFAFKLEKHPKDVPNRPAHHYPRGTRRWIRAWGLFVARVAPGSTWRSRPVTLAPHVGDWHAGADIYAAYRHRGLAITPPPRWMDGFVGWSEILGKTYLGEVFHDFKRCADQSIRDAKVTGLDLVFYYGHTNIGAEGADYDQSPAADLGGEAGFAAMLDRLHRAGCRIMLLDHLHRWINSEIPQYAAEDLDQYAVLGPDGRRVEARWWKETFLSCRRLAGPTPVWVEMCPFCQAWRDIYLRHVTAMIARGVDGLELDTLLPSERCYATTHGHAPGAPLLPAKMDFLKALHRHVRGLSGDFAIFGEATFPECRQHIDGFYPHRFVDENGRIYRYMFPELTQQAVRVGNYAYDAVNKALALGIGVETEIDGLRETTLAACPELARYIGEVNRFKRRHADILIRGRFRDTRGGHAVGSRGGDAAHGGGAADACGVLWSVIEGESGTALVLRNPTPVPIRALATFDAAVSSPLPPGEVGPKGRVRVGLRETPQARLTLWRPFAAERPIRRLPIDIRLKPYEAAVVMALRR